MAAASKKRASTSVATAGVAAGTPARVALRNLIPSKINPRKTMDPEFIADIGEQMTNTTQMQPMLARPTATDGILEVFVGHTRLAGFSKMAEIGKIDLDYLCDVKIFNVSDQEALAMAIAENYVRRAVPPLEECSAIADALASGVSKRELSRATGLRPGDIEDRMAVTRADERIRLLVANGDRTIAWAGRFDRLTKQEQFTVTNEMDRNPKSYATVRDLHDLTRQGKILTRNAIFDIDASGLAVTQDLFDPTLEWFEDSQAFWDRQNNAVQEKVVELERIGHAKVEVLRSKPYLASLWRKTDSPRNAEAKIVVNDDGSIEIHDQLLPASQPDGNQVSHDDDEHTTAANLGFISSPEDGEGQAPVDNVTTISSKPPRNKLAKAALARMRVDRAALLVIQNAEYAERLMLASFLGDDRLRSTPVRSQIDANQIVPETALVAEQCAMFKERAEAAAADKMAFVSALSIAEVRALNAIAIAMRLGNQRGDDIEFADNALVREILRTKCDNGGRGDYVPDAALFKLIDIGELRLLAAELLGPQDALYAETAPRDELAVLMGDRFRQAADGDATIDHGVAFRLNAWWPSYL